MAIIYAPYIADTIPGFLTTKIKIPFTMNPAVGWSEIYGFKLQIKNYNGNEIIATSIWAKEEYDEVNEITFTSFTLSPGVSEFPVVGQYYKFQLAYMENAEDTNLVFSSASIGKCIANDVFNTEVEGLNINLNNGNKGIYFGNPGDNTEPIYSYRFVFKQGDNIIQDTDDILVKQNENYRFKLEYDNDKFNNNSYTLSFTITTINGYTETSSYQIVKHSGSELNSNHSITHMTDEPEEEKGYIKLQTKHTIVSGSKTFLLERTVDQQNYEELVQYTADSTHTTFVWRDCSIEAGQYYYYSIREVNNNGQLLSKRKFIVDDENQPLPISIDYEDTFLTDITGKQLCIKFNPKVSSFKDIIQEAKTETIGSKYPFFFRNGYINYKEIPISGLISYQMDEDFMTDAELGVGNIYAHAAAGQGVIASVEETVQRGINLDGPNFAAERKFKLKVMEWLNNGTPKLFRSPAEGVYIIRLMNISLSPNETLGRMLHSFSATGYEVSDHDLELLKEKGYINYPEESYAASSRLGWFVLGTSVLGGNA